MSKNQHQQSKSRSRKLSTEQQKQTRTFSIEQISEEEKNSNLIELSFSSEEPVRRGFGWEVLSHEAGSVNFERLNNGGALLVNHNPDSQVGVVENAFLGDDRKGRATVRFGKSAYAQEIRQDVMDGIRKLVSVQYSLDDVEETEKRDDIPVYTATRWTPYEISIVSIPADTTVGVGRSDEKTETEIEQTKQDEKKEVRSMSDETKEIKTEPQVDINSIREEARKAENKRIAEINAIANKFKDFPVKDGDTIENITNSFIADGKSVDEFRKSIMNYIEKPVAMDSSKKLGLSEKEARQFSFVKALRGIISNKHGGSWKGAEYEREVMTAERDRLSASGYVIPEEVLQSRLLGIATPTSSTSGSYYVTGNTGQYLVATDHLAGSFIDVLRNKIMVKQLGATIMSGLVGNVAIPKQLTGSSAMWFTESDTSYSYETHYQAQSSKEPTFGQVTLSPKWISTRTDVTSKLLHQGSPDVENIIRNDIAAAIALGIDSAALYGGTTLGAAGTPNGLKASLTAYTSENSSATDTTVSLTWGDIVGLESAIAGENADISNMSYLTSAKGRGLLKQTLRVASSTFADYLWQNGAEYGVGVMNGYPAYASNQVLNTDTATAQAGKGAINTNVFFGNWADLLIGEWGGIEVLVDESTYFGQGGVIFYIRRMCDIALRRTESFGYIDEFSG